MSWDAAPSAGGGSWDSGPAAPIISDEAQVSDGFDASAADGYGDADATGASGGGGCFNCGEEGHMKSECPNPRAEREFTGSCRLCEKTGHRASDCPDAPPKVCKNCTEKGHVAMECKNPRKVNRDHIEDVLAEVAWEKIKAAAEEKDFDEVKIAVNEYVKAVPETTYVELERAFRNQGVEVYIIALERDLATTYSIMDLQGNLDRKFCISYRKSANPARPKEHEGWPEPEENLVRLADAGEPIDRGISKCSNCNELGHIAKSCPEEKRESDNRAEVKCFNCDEVGHRVRDCPNPRPDKFACRNCKKSGHSSKECPEPRSAEGVECKKCNEVGHFSRDCPQGGGSRACNNCGSEEHMQKECPEPKNLDNMICRNCDEKGHVSKECPKPRDYSRVQCQNCKQMGHTKVRCKEPHVDDNANDNYGGGGETTGADNGNYGTAAASDNGGDNWTTSASANVSGW